MADKFTALLIDALGRAARAPGGTPLVGTKKLPGLFPPTALARQAARRAVDDGLLQAVTSGPNAAENLDLWTVSESGIAYLLEQTSPKQVLDDLVRALEARRDDIDGLRATAEQLQATLEGIKALVVRVLPRLSVPGPPALPAADWLEDCLDHLSRWHETASGDCPLPELYRRLQDHVPDLTIGRFHDGLRALHARARLALHLWTGPLYALPEPTFALLVGHEIAYYASLRSDSRPAPGHEPDQSALFSSADLHAPALA